MSSITGQPAPSGGRNSAVLETPGDRRRGTAPSVDFAGTTRPNASALNSGRRKSVAPTPPVRDAAKPAGAETLLMPAGPALPLPDDVVRRVRESDGLARRAAAVAELVSEVAAADSPREAGDRLVDLVAPAVGASTAAWCELRRGRPVVRSVAGRRVVETSGPTADLIEAAAEEALLAGRLLQDVAADARLAPNGRRGGPEVADVADRAVALRVLREEFRSPGAVACPVGTSGVLVTVGRIDRHAADWIRAAATPLEDVLRLLEEARGSKLRTLCRVPRSRWLQACVAVFVTTAVLATPVPHTLPASAALVPASRRVAVAPFEGLLQDVRVEAGDVVALGQTLATMDGRETRWERAGLMAEQSAALKKRDRARAAGDITESQLAQLEADRLARRADLLARRESRLRVAAGIEGVVLSAEYERQSSVPVRTGDPLFEIAPLSPVRVEVAVPAEEFRHLRAGQTARVALDGGGTVEGVLRSVRPGSEVRDGRNVFIARFELPNADALLRPGQTGTASVAVGRRSLGWVLFHRVGERLDGWWRTRVAAMSSESPEASVEASG